MYKLTDLLNKRDRIDLNYHEALKILIKSQKDCERQHNCTSITNIGQVVSAVIEYFKMDLELKNEMNNLLLNLASKNKE